jgi:hypothetical protein
MKSTEKAVVSVSLQIVVRKVLRSNMAAGKLTEQSPVKSNLSWFTKEL